MRTAHLLPVSPIMHCSGGSGGVPARGGVPAQVLPHCEQNSWHTQLKILPCPKLRAIIIQWYCPEIVSDQCKLLFWYFMQHHLAYLHYNITALRDRFRSNWKYTHLNYQKFITSLRITCYWKYTCYFPDDNPPPPILGFHLFWRKYFTRTGFVLTQIFMRKRRTSLVPSSLMDPRGRQVYFLIFM